MHLQHPAEITLLFQPISLPPYSPTKIQIRFSLSSVAVNACIRLSIFHAMLIFCFASSGEFICLFNFTGALNTQINNRRWLWAGSTICVHGVPRALPEVLTLALRFHYGAWVYASLVIIYLAKAIIKLPPRKDSMCGRRHVSPLNHWL